MELSSLDYVAQACMDLNEAMSTVQSEAERDTLIVNHIKKVWPTVIPIDDFKKNLEWVNVSEPISLAQHCADKVVILDFWTYCCINCYHVLPDLAHIEKLHKVENGLVVLGVHCAKFTNEKDSSKVLAAVQRYNIHHPVVNDADSYMWETMGIRCWPTLLILGPGNKPLFVLTGEGHKDELVWFVGNTLRHFGTRIATTPLPMSLSGQVKRKEEDMLYFPSKLALNPFYRGRTDEPFLAISDTGHHRVLLTDCSGIVLRIIGGCEPGFKDGKLVDAQFDSPQGLCWLSSNVLAVCDTNNHSVRAIHLDEGTVEVLAGTGQQGVYGDQGGKCMGVQPLASPWDVMLYTTPDMDMSVRPLLPPPPPPPSAPGTPEKPKDDGKDEAKEKEKKDEKRRVLLIACAGSHQIWALFLDTTIWWKYKTFTEGTCVCIAGSGQEAARNSAYPNSAAFAQPSGITLRMGTSPEIFIADSESSSIRRLALTTGQVSTLCGGDRNPLNLFAFGDVDDIGVDAKLQHPLGVAYCDSSKTLYVADTYNHKIKKVEVGPQKVTTLNPTMIETTDPATFNEPSGLSITADGKYLYIADTNNHCVKILNLTKNVCQDFKVRLLEPKFTEPENLILYKNDMFLNRKCGNLIIYFNITLDSDKKNVKFTPGAPQNWLVCVRDENNVDVTQDFEFINSSHKGTKLPGRVEMKLKQKTDKFLFRLYMSFHTSLCDATVCFPHSFTLRSTILVRASVKMVESYRISCTVNPNR